MAVALMPGFALCIECIKSTKSRKNIVVVSDPKDAGTVVFVKYCVGSPASKTLVQLVHLNETRSMSIGPLDPITFSLRALASPVGAQSWQPQAGQVAVHIR